MASQQVLQFPQLQTPGEFNNWKFRVRTLLERNSVLEAIEDVKETSSKEWKQNDATARNIIVQCLPDRYLEIIKGGKTAGGMFKSLEEHFERKSVLNKLHLRRKLINLKCTTSLEDHFLIFEKLVTELEATGPKIESLDKICYLLSSLSEEYEQVITSIETMSTEKEISVEFVKVRLLDAELKLKEKQGRNRHGDNEAFSANTIKCYRCGKPGHKSFECRTGRGRGRIRRGFRGRGRGRFSEDSAAARVSDDNSDGLAFISCDEVHASVINEMHLVVDSACTEHLVKEEYEGYMTDIIIMENPIKIYVANGQYLHAFKKGKVKLKVNGVAITLEALIIKNLTYNLLSVKKIVEKGHKVNFDNSIVKIFNNKAQVVGKLNGKLYYIIGKLCNDSVDDEQCNIVSDDLWHKRLGHLHRKGLQIMKLPVGRKVCPECMKAKSTRLPFKSVESPRSRDVAELLHSDIAGPIRPATDEGEIYYQTVIDDYSHFCEVYLLKNKSDATENLISYIKKIETETGKKVKRIRSDNGGEYTCKKMKDFCKDKGIQLETTIPHTPQQNGVSERMNRTLYNKARTIINESNLPKQLWGEAIRCAAYQLNRCPSAAIWYKIPTDIRFGKTDLTRLKIFGARGWMVNIPKQDKLSERAKEVRMVGYAKNGYRLWDPVHNKIMISRDVRFDENDIRYKSREEKVERRCYEEKCEEEMQESIKESEDIMVEEQKQEQDTEEMYDKEQKISDKEVKTTKSGRTVKTPKHLKDYKTEFETNIVYCLCMGDPQNYDEAIKSGEDWQVAIEKELDAHEKQGTWKVTNLPQGKKPIDTKWVFRTKSDGSKKARLVAKGYQEETYTNVYSPVARMPTIRMFLSHSLQENLTVRQLDVPTAFLHGKLNMEVYIKPPQGVSIKEGKVLKLEKGLYGLKEAPRCWNERFHKYIVSMGFVQSQYDFYLYKKEDVWVSSLSMTYWYQEIL